jgi:RimJ/RimL family protein N-acetyltransferase
VDVVELGPDDWRRWRTLRLAALAEAPQAFSSTLAGTLAADDEGWWRARLTTVPHNLVVVRDGADVAMVSLTGPGEDGAPELVSMWVAPAARGSDVADAAVRAVLALADDDHRGLPVVLSVYADNRAALRLYARHGFVDAGVSPDDPRERRMRRAER